MWPSYCRSNGCLYCTRYKVFQMTKAIRLASPGFLVTLTRLCGIWTKDRHTLSRFRSLARTSVKSSGVVYGL